MTRPISVSKGLDDVVIGRSSISLVAGETGGLVYRGFDIAELVPGVPYESVVHLLLRGTPPPEDPAENVTDGLRQRRDLPLPIAALVDAIPSERAPLDAMRTILSGLSDESFAYPPTVDQGLTLMARLPTAFARFVQRSMHQPPISPRPDLGQVANYLNMLTGSVPDSDRLHALESYFVLLADHGMNASTFALCVVISTQSDLVSAETAALGALKGPVHGGAPSRVIDMLDAIGSVDDAVRGIAARLQRGEVLYGFGHRAYKVEDPRAVLLKQIAQRVATPERLELALTVEREALAALHIAKPNARLNTNVEYWGAVVLEAVGLKKEWFTPTFALARTAGWAAHALEQADDNRLIRPEVEYVGAPTGSRWPRPRAEKGP
ncbi:MAG: citrate/2-methylcitrate synthase [Thermoplasmata archaeon]